MPLSIKASAEYNTEQNIMEVSVETRADTRYIPQVQYEIYHETRYIRWNSPQTGRFNLNSKPYRPARELGMSSHLGIV